MSRYAVLLMGPTGAGKSELALKLTELLPLEIISVDSAQVYQQMDIGTAKPSAQVRARVPHHLIDIRDPSMSYSAGEFTRDALEAMQDIWRRGKQPLLAGGTMLYFHALTHGIAKLPEADPQVRAGIDAQAASVGWPALHGELAGVDPQAAARIHVNDPQRIQRALEVYRLTGKTITSLQQIQSPVFAGVPLIEVALAPLERSALHAAIGLRFQAMLTAGLLEEVRGLYQRGDLSAEHPSMRAVGYRQLWRHLAGQCDLKQAAEQAVAATRQLAKRQLTWLRRRNAALWFDSLDAEVSKAVLGAIRERLAC
jgi:tRNA dimethylallyltransferase